MRTRVRKHSKVPGKCIKAICHHIKYSDQTSKASDMIHYQTVVGDSNKGVMVEYVGSTLHYQSGGHKFILQRVHQEQFKEGQFSSFFQSINQATKTSFTQT